MWPVESYSFEWFIILNFDCKWLQLHWIEQLNQVKETCWLFFMRIFLFPISSPTGSANFSHRWGRNDHGRADEWTDAQNLTCHLPKIWSAHVGRARARDHPPCVHESCKYSCTCTCTGTILYSWIHTEFQYWYQICVLRMRMRKHEWKIPAWWQVCVKCCVSIRNN